MYGICGRSTGQLLTCQGMAILHGNREEMEFLFPAEKIVPVPNWNESFMPLRDHPDMVTVRWPLQKEDFR
jgi:hypothetical protein